MRITNEILKKYESYVCLLAWKIAKNGTDYEDLVQCGYIGLIKAGRKYDKGKAKFITYATYWIKREMKMYYEENGRTIRIPHKVPKNIIAQPISYDMDIKEDIRLIDFIADQRRSEYEIEEDKLDIKRLIKNVAKKLTANNKTIFKLYIKKKNCAKVAKTLNVSRQYINLVIQKIRKILVDISGEGSII